MVLALIKESLYFEKHSERTERCSSDMRAKVITYFRLASILIVAFLLTTGVCLLLLPLLRLVFPNLGYWHVLLLLLYMEGFCVLWSFWRTSHKENKAKQALLGIAALLVPVFFAHLALYGFTAPLKFLIALPFVLGILFVTIDCLIYIWGHLSRISRKTEKVLIKEPKYEGKFVTLRSVKDSSVIAYADSPCEVSRLAAEQGIDEPVIFFVPETDVISVYRLPNCKFQTLDVGASWNGCPATSWQFP